MNLHRLDLTTLALFVSVARTGSISRGAELAHLAVGAASKRIADLEAAVGVPLLDRHSRGVVLTPAGSALVERARRVLQEVEHLSTEMSDYSSGLVGVVKLWANTSAITEFLPQRLASFQSANPGIRIELEEQNSGDVVMAILDGRADFGIFADRTPTLGLSVVFFAEDQLVVVVPKDHPLSDLSSVRFSELLDFDIVSLPSPTSLAQRLQQETEVLGRRLRLRIQVRSFDAMCLMVAAGMGIAVLPSAAVGPHLVSMDLKKIALEETWARRQLLIGMRDPDSLSRPARTLIDHLCTNKSV